MGGGGGKGGTRVTHEHPEGLEAAETAGLSLPLPPFHPDSFSKLVRGEVGGCFRQLWRQARGLILSPAQSLAVAPLHLMTTSHTWSPRKRSSQITDSPPNSQKPNPVIKSWLGSYLVTSKSRLSWPVLERGVGWGPGRCSLPRDPAGPLSKWWSPLRQSQTLLAGEVHSACGKGRLRDTESHCIPTPGLCGDLCKGKSQNSHHGNSHIH